MVICGCRSIGSRLAADLHRLAEPSAVLLARGVVVRAREFNPEKKRTAMLYITCSRVNWHISSNLSKVRGNNPRALPLDGEFKQGLRPQQMIAHLEMASLSTLPGRAGAPPPRPSRLED